MVNGFLHNQPDHDKVVKVNQLYLDFSDLLGSE